jgi:hypothetical protein
MKDFFPLPNVITGLVPVIHSFLPAPGRVDGRHKAGHDDL